MQVSYLDEIRRWIAGNPDASWDDLEDFMLGRNYRFIFPDDQYLVECWMDV